MTRKVAVSKQSRICSWQAGKGRWAKLIGGTIRVRAILYFLTFCGSLFAPFSSLSVSLISCTAAYRPGPAAGPNDPNIQSVSIIFPTPQPCRFHLHTEIMHWTWQASEAVDTSCHEYTVAGTVCAGQGGQICTTCSVLLAYSHVQVLLVGSHIVLNVLILDEWLVSLILYEPNSRVICLHINHSTPLTYSGKTASLFNWMTWNNHTHWWG